MVGVTLEDMESNVTPEQKQDLAEKQIAFNNLFLQLRRLPHGPDSEVDEKRRMHAELVRSLDQFDETTRVAMLPKVHEALEHSLLTEEELKAVLDTKYKV